MSTRVAAAVLNQAPGQLEVEELTIDDPGRRSVDRHTASGPPMSSAPTRRTR